MDEKSDSETKFISDIEITVTNEESDCDKEIVSISSQTPVNSKPHNQYLQIPGASQEAAIDGNSSDGNGTRRYRIMKGSIVNLTDMIHDSINTRKNVTKLIKLYTVGILVVVASFLTGIFLAPIILYYTRQPTRELFVLDGADFERCSVSGLIICNRMVFVIC